jgi:hypothetical protein
VAFPYHVGTTAFVLNNGAIQNVVWPTHQTNDIGFCVVEASGNSAVISVPAGWDLMCDQRDVSTIAGSRFHVLGRRATSAAEGGCNFPAQLDHKIYGMVTFRGVDPAIAVASFPKASGAKGVASTTITFPSVTTTTSDNTIVVFGSRANDSASVTNFGTTVALASTGGLVTELVELLEAGDLTANGGGLMIGYGRMATVGATNTITCSTANLTNTMCTVALPGLPIRRAPVRPRGNINNRNFY